MIGFICQWHRWKDVLIRQAIAIRIRHAPCFTGQVDSFGRSHQIYPGNQHLKLIVREILRRSGSIYIDRDGFLTLRWPWLKKLYSWTYKI
jgi:hypothetical protein